MCFIERKLFILSIVLITNYMANPVYQKIKDLNYAFIKEKI